MLTISKQFDNGFTLAAQGETVQDAIQAFTDSCAAEWLQEPKCGVCGGTNIVPHCRSVPDPTDKKGKSTFWYPEMKCLRPGCWATLELGQRKDGGLYPKRKDKEGAFIPNSGWKKFVKKDSGGEE